MDSKVKISVIIPLYYGKKYIPDICSMMQENHKHLQERGALELIFVNDSPEEAITRQDIPAADGIDVILRNNEKNVGIHGSRVAGLVIATGTYVMFFDQDDEIAGNYFVSQLKKIGKADVVVSNGIAQYPDWNKILYRCHFMQQTVKCMWFYAKFDCRIISPGQCLIKKEAIPKEWKEYLICNNGADDFFLWLLMLSRHKKFAINREKIYTHIYTANNTSLDTDKMNRSVQEIIAYNGQYRLFSKQYERMIKNRLEQKRTSFLVKTVERMNREK